MLQKISLKDNVRAHPHIHIHRIAHTHTHVLSNTQIHPLTYDRHSAFHCTKQHQVTPDNLLRWKIRTAMTIQIYPVLCSLYLIAERTHGNIPISWFKKITYFTLPDVWTGRECTGRNCVTSNQLRSIWKSTQLIRISNMARLLERYSKANSYACINKIMPTCVDGRHSAFSYPALLIPE